MRRMPKRLSRGEKIGIVAIVLGLVLLPVAPQAALFFFLLFLLLSLAAPFFPQWSFFLPVISHGRPGEKGVALTFDDGPSPQSTPVILDLLARYRLSATFFVVGKQAAAHPELIAEILAQGHTIGNHSLQHDSLLMLRGPQNLADDIHQAQEIVAQSGVRPLVFRPPVGITNPHLGRVLAEEGMVAIGYSCRALDRGNRNITSLAEKILGKLQPGAIILLHDLPPYKANLSDQWQQELEQLLRTLAADYTVVPLAQLIGRPVMERVNQG
ncbi:MAG TPA: polysaccharide deacetylase family protein [Desulfobulbaceae bacterium]|nr:polysaccharide deacetylase family protein [Desulfobulbaceae bacterium]